MALIVRSPDVNVDGRQLDRGELIPKEYENDPSRSWSAAVSLGRVDRIPDSAVEGDIPQRFEEDIVRVEATILEQSVHELEEDLEEVSDLDSLDKLLQIEKNNQNRTTAIHAIEERQEELLNILSGEE